MGVAEARIADPIPDLRQVRRENVLALPAFEIQQLCSMTEVSCLVLPEESTSPGQTRPAWNESSWANPLRHFGIEHDLKVSCCPSYEELRRSFPEMQSSPLSTRAIPLSAIVLLAIAVHAPLLLMQIPLGSYDANTHIFFASHYANHWFNPWNDKWYGGFTQTTYPPLTHQWIGLLSHVLGLNFAYMFVQLVGIVLLVIGVYRFAKLWVNERAASYAAIGSIFLGSLAMLVYQSGQLPTTFAAALTLNALPYFYAWMRYARFSALLKGIVIGATAAVAHHATLLFGTSLFAFPVIWLALRERDDERGDDASIAGVASRTVIFLVILLVAIAIVL